MSSAPQAAEPQNGPAPAGLAPLRPGWLGHPVVTGLLAAWIVASGIFYFFRFSLEFYFANRAVIQAIFEFTGT